MRIAFGFQDFRLLLAFGLQDLAQFDALRLQDRGALLPLRFHLARHGVGDVARRLDFLNFHAGDFAAPVVGGFVQHLAQIRIDHVARHQRFVQRAVSDQIAQIRLRQRRAGVPEILHLILRLHRIDDFVIDHSVDFHRHVVFGNELLRRDGDHLLAHVHAHNVVHEGQDEREPRLRDGVKFPQPRD